MKNPGMPSKVLDSSVGKFLAMATTMVFLYLGTPIGWGDSLDPCNGKIPMVIEGTLCGEQRACEKPTNEGCYGTMVISEAMVNCSTEGATKNDHCIMRKQTCTATYDCKLDPTGKICEKGKASLDQDGKPVVSTKDMGTFASCVAP